MQLIEQVAATIRRHDLAHAGTRVVVALSGGPDSVALTHLCRALHDAGAFVLAGVAHLNHRLREGADADAAFAADVARSLHLPIESGAVDVAALAAARGLSIETAAHDARYDFLRAAARTLGADRIALGHTLDDQAETVLLRLIRGAGSRGLAGMYPRHGLFIRPLLDVRRQQVLDFLGERGLTWREDPSNADRSIPRNRVRADLLPLLARDFNPRIVHVLGQQAELSREEWDWLEKSADGLVGLAAHGHSTEMSVDVAPIQAAHPAVARTALRRLLERGSHGRPISLAHVERALALFAPDDSADPALSAPAADFPGQRLERHGTRVVLTSRLSTRRPTSETVEQPGARAFRYPLAVPGEARVPEAGATLVAQVEPGGLDAVGHATAKIPVNGAGAEAVVRLERFRAGSTWAVRSRAPGDRLTWQGLGGRKKVHDLFVDRKVPRAERDRVPIVVDDQDRIVWVAGHAVAGEFRVTDPAQAVVILRLKLWGGSV